MQTASYRPFEKFSTAMLFNVVNRGRYARYGKDFETALQYELQLRGNPRAN